MTDEEAPVADVDEPSKNTEKSTTSTKKPTAPRREPYHVVSGNDVDEVHLSAFKPGKKQKSLSIHHAQRALVEKGFDSAFAGRDGTFDEITQAALAEFQKSVGYEDTGLMDDHTLSALFDNDPNVVVKFD